MIIITNEGGLAEALPALAIVELSAMCCLEAKHAELDGEAHSAINTDIDLGSIADTQEFVFSGQPTATLPLCKNHKVELDCLNRLVDPNMASAKTGCYSL